MSDAAQFYANRVLKEYKEKDPTHVEWVKQWMKTLTELHAYVKQYHTTGLNWGTHDQQDLGAVAALARNVGSIAPPPPPPPPPASALSSTVNIDDGQSRNELLNSINALGSGAASHLKKVPDQLKLHKNPQLRDQVTHQPLERSNASNKSQVCLFLITQ